MATQIASKYSLKTDLFFPILDKVNLIWMVIERTADYPAKLLEIQTNYKPVRWCEPTKNELLKSQLPFMTRHLQMDLN